MSLDISCAKCGLASVPPHSLRLAGCKGLAGGPPSVLGSAVLSSADGQSRYADCQQVLPTT